MVTITPEIATQRILALHSFFENLPKHQKSKFDTAEDFYIEVFKILGHATSARIIYFMYMFKISAAKELANKLNSTNHAWILTKLYYYENIGLFEQIYKDKDNQRYYQKMWKKMYPTSPCLPTLFKMNDDFVDLISLYAEDIKSRYIDLQSTQIIKDRLVNFQHITSSIAKDDDRKKIIESNTLYKCEQCDDRIFKRHKNGKDYHLFPVGAICKTCFHRSDKERLKEWKSKS